MKIHIFRRIFLRLWYIWVYGLITGFEVDVCKRTCMEPSHPAWKKFCRRMKGAGGLDLKGQPTVGGWGRTIYVEHRDNPEPRCNEDPSRPITTRLLESMSGIDVQDSLEYFKVYGGFCDCLVALNVLDAMDQIPALSPKTIYRKATGATRRGLHRLMATLGRLLWLREVPPYQVGRIWLNNKQIISSSLMWTLLYPRPGKRWVGALGTLQYSPDGNGPTYHRYIGIVEWEPR
jgi:hypothetical protein